MNENERIVCEFLRKIAPPREWEYLGEVEHYWISQLCGELNKQLKVENTKLRELVHLVANYVSADQCEGCVTKRACSAGELDMCWIRKAILEKLRELGVEVS